MKKNTTQNEMKEMAKDFLKEKGVIKEEKEINKPRKKAIKTEASQPESIINPERYYSRSIKKQEQSIPISKDFSTNSEKSKSYIKSQNAHNRFQYLNCSVEKLKNSYEDKKC